MLIRFLALLLLGLTVACTAGAKGEDEAARTGASSGLRIETVTPMPTVAAAANAASALVRQAGVVQTLDGSASTLLAPAETETPEPEDEETEPTVEATEAIVEPSETPAPATATATRTPRVTPTPSNTPLPGLSPVESELVHAHNVIREEHGLPELDVNPTLMQIARARAEAMASMGSLTHYNSNGTTVFDMMNAAGYAYSDGGENIHYNGGFSEVQSWQRAMSDYLASASHRAAMLKPHFREIGVGVAMSGGTRYYSIVFSD